MNFSEWKFLDLFNLLNDKSKFIYNFATWCEKYIRIFVMKSIQVIFLKFTAMMGLVCNLSLQKGWHIFGADENGWRTWPLIISICIVQNYLASKINIFFGLIQNYKPPSSVKWKNLQFLKKSNIMKQIQV